MAKRYDLLIRLLLIGDSGVGKTCMICRFTDDAFRTNDNMTTIGIDFKMKSVEMDGKTVRVQLWDTAGQERYETLTQQYYRRAQGICFVYDITNEKTFNNLEKWMNYAKKYAADDVQMMLLANKSDMQKNRKVPKEKGQKLAKGLKIPFYETSAKKSDNINKAFTELTHLVLLKNKKQFDAIQLERKDSDGGEYISELLREDEQRGSCC